MAIAAACVWEVRSTGSDNNGGGFVTGGAGTDYSQQDAPVLSVSDAAATGTTNLSSATGGFTSNMVNNVVNVVGQARRQITAFVDTNNVTCDAAWGTFSGATANVGGAAASPGLVAGVVTADNIVYGTGQHTISSSTANVSGGRVAPSVRSRWIGYRSTRGDAKWWDPPWSIKAGVNSITIFAPSTHDIAIEHVELDGDKASRTGTTGFVPSSSWQGLRALNCRVKNCNSHGLGGGVAAYWIADLCEVIDCGGVGFWLNGSCFGCLASGSGSVGFAPLNSFANAFVSCVATKNGANGWNLGAPVNIVGCAAIGNTGSGFNVTTNRTMFVNGISYANSTYGWETSAAQDSVTLLNCAGGYNRSGDFNGTHIALANKIGFIPLAGDPFVNWRGRDFRLNKLASAALRGRGFGAFPGAYTTGYPDIGPVQMGRIRTAWFDPALSRLEPADIINVSGF